jgi:hypothetical protein
MLCNPCEVCALASEIGITRTATAAASTNSNLPISPSLSKTTNVESMIPANSLNSESDNFNSGEEQKFHRVPFSRCVIVFVGRC